jgi:hypothetical protein
LISLSKIVADTTDFYTVDKFFFRDTHHIHGHLACHNLDTLSDRRLD